MILIFLFSCILSLFVAFWVALKDVESDIDELKGDDEQNPCESCYYAEGSPYCLKYCPHDAERKSERED